MDHQQRFRVNPGARLRLKDVDSAFKGVHGDREGAEQESARYQLKLHDLQAVLYAERKHSLLICLQGMDTAGKDGTISHVLGAMNPQGCRTVAFKEPTVEEQAHDFLWRAHRATPAKGEVVIFNRSHYESVLIERVHELVPKKVWSRRYDRINSFERGMTESGTLILKFFLHISNKKQLKRFKDRLDDPSKRWKISEADYKEREYWDDYQEAYEEALSRCSTEGAPWFVIPSDHKWFRDLAVARIVVEQLEALKMSYPKPTVDIEKIRVEYHAAKQIAKRPSAKKRRGP